MQKISPNLRNFLTGAAIFMIGVAAGSLFIGLVARFGLVRWLINLVDKNQILVQILAVPVIAGFMLALGGAILGGIGGWALASIIQTQRKGRLVVGSAISFALSISLLFLVFMLLTSFIALYNNLTTNRIEQYALIFGLYGLVFGLFVGILQALLTVRLRYSWQVILAAVLGFTLGGVILGLLVRLVNPTAGYKTYPILTSIILFLGLVAPFALGGGALGFTYGHLAQRFSTKNMPVEALGPSRWQMAVVAVIGIIGVYFALGTLNHITDFLTIRPANFRKQIPSETIATQWTSQQAYDAAVAEYKPVPEGLGPVTITGPDMAQYQAWCSSDGTIQFQHGSEPPEHIEFPGCNSAPAMALDVDGRPHIVWYTREIRDTNGEIREVSLLVESIRDANSWSEPAIAAQTSGQAAPYLTTAPDGTLILIWTDSEQKQYYSLQEPYHCDPQMLNEPERAGLASILSGGFYSKNATIPYCQNEFRTILYTPNPEPEYSSNVPTPNGAFDRISAQTDAASYEVLFATMQYEPNSTPPSPGSVLADGVAKLYRDVKDNPEKYPRGMTVRILLGNYPVVTDLEWGSQIYTVISDLRDAGVDKMVDPEIGWRLEVANFPGVYPHSHTKFLVVDGSYVAAVGFNYGYLHLPKDHPSGEGYDMFDLGLVIQGPIAQEAVSVYDDMWWGADQVYCADLFPADGTDWKATCQDEKANSDHVPEVLRYDLPPQGNTNSFSLYRNTVYKQSDQFVETSIASAQDNIDIIEVNFSLQAICVLNLIFPNACNFDNALPWMQALVQSVEDNHTHVRVIMENSNSNGMENRIAGIVLMDELKRRGLNDLVELRFYNGKVHAKSMLIDDKLLIIGSQNLHYSAFGDRGLNEYNITTDDPTAIAEYQKLFEDKWSTAIPFEEAEYATTP